MKAFISYSRKDRKDKEKFLKQLMPIREKFGLDVFHDQTVLPGEEWEQRIWKEFEESQIVFVLISDEFLNSNFCYKKEFERAIVRHEKKQIVVVPIILKTCLWKEIRQLAKLAALPDGGEPVHGGRFKSLDAGFANAIAGIDQRLSLMAASSRRGRASRRPPRPSLAVSGDTLQSRLL